MRIPTAAAWCTTPTTSSSKPLLVSSPTPPPASWGHSELVLSNAKDLARNLHVAFSVIPDPDRGSSVFIFCSRAMHPIAPSIRGS